MKILMKQFQIAGHTEKKMVVRQFGENIDKDMMS